MVGGSVMGGSTVHAIRRYWRIEGRSANSQTAEFRVSTTFSGYTVRRPGDEVTTIYKGSGMVFVMSQVMVPSSDAFRRSRQHTTVIRKFFVREIFHTLNLRTK